MKSKSEYYKLCDNDDRLPREPDEIFKNNFVSWSDYFSINRQEYYDLELCKSRVHFYMRKNQNMIKMYPDLSKICDILCALDKKFPPNELWADYYKCQQTDIITLPVINTTEDIDDVLFNTL